MDVDYLIQNGTVVDGTGAPAYRADVRVRGGKIAEVGQGLERQDRERVIDATDCYVAPGTIEQHNHWDAAIWWSPIMEPGAAYGITTSINGSCGFSLAPLSAERDIRQEIIDIFNYFEDIPESPTRERLPWDWRTWGEYKRSMERRVKTSTNVGFFCGHVTLRIAVMGEAAWERAATEAEVQQMCTLLDEALAAGALGFSSNLLDYDKRERPLPPMKADEAEWLALMRVVARHPKAVMQVPVDALMRRNAVESSQMLARVLRKVPGIRIQIAGIPPVLAFQKDLLPPLESLYHEMQAEGLDVWAGYHHVGYSLQLNFVASLLFAQQGNFVWQEIVNEPDEEKKLAMLQDPEWRRRARESWDNQFFHTLLNRPAELLLRESETGNGPVGISLADYMAQNGIEHPSDGLAEWALENGMRSAVQMPAWENNDDVLLRLFRDPRSVGNVSDFGAHNTLFCGAGHNMMLLTEWVRDRKLISIEEAIHCLTGKVAEHFGLGDRGTLHVGKQADLIVFNLDEIEVRPEIKMWDVPDGSGGLTFRYVRAPAPMRLTLVNGIATFDQGLVTGNFPGRVLTRENAGGLKMAAE
jgi:N-acyl-D-aspartate/D-glutamate deacylase